MGLRSVAVCRDHPKHEARRNEDQGTCEAGKALAAWKAPFQPGRQQHAHGSGFEEDDAVKKKETDRIPTAKMPSRQKKRRQATASSGNGIGGSFCVSSLVSAMSNGRFGNPGSARTLPDHSEAAVQASLNVFVSRRP